MVLTISDYLIRATAGRGSIRALVATTTGLVEEARRRHKRIPRRPPLLAVFWPRRPFWAPP